MSQNVVVIGGGPAGIEASRRLRDLGYIPILIEKEPVLGGHLARWDRLFPDGVEAHTFLDPMLSDLDGIKYFTDTEVSSINRLKDTWVVKLSNGLSAQVRAILLTTGFDLFKAEKKEEYGYGIYERVITNADLEAWFKSGAAPQFDDVKTIGFVHCVGSRDEKAGNRQCSKVCCVTAVKQACEIKERFPEATVYCFYMDLRMFGRRYEDLYLKAQKDCGIRFVRGRVSEVSEDLDGHLFVKAEDTLFGKPMKIKLDMLVLMAGMTPSAGTQELSRMVNIQTGDDGFFLPKSLIASPFTSSREGIFFAGAATGPKTLPETLSEASAAALAIDRFLKTPEKR
ncbi:MAG: CoB--CoM heterodisulfide reductase iron-sulfur subunit A family protein [Bacteroidales bacterium]|jgi:heterodisulfide reductase subunit A|nr:CoB--CoM heterodisulfide reductase iron-sulfur subunit A family protein [Bacteroidales bacterium]